MADNKQYINQEHDQGNVLISEDVISKIVAQAIKESENSAETNVVELVNKKNYNRAIKISINEKNELTVTCNVNIAYGQNVLTIAKAVQNSVANALESMAGVTILSVNVNVAGIIHQ